MGLFPALACTYLPRSWPCLPALRGSFPPLFAFKLGSPSHCRGSTTIWKPRRRNGGLFRRILGS